MESMCSKEKEQHLWMVGFLSFSLDSSVGLVSPLFSGRCSTFPFSAARFPEEGMDRISSNKLICVSMLLGRTLSLIRLKRSLSSVRRRGELLNFIALIQQVLVLASSIWLRDLPSCDYAGQHSVPGFRDAFE